MRDIKFSYDWNQKLDGNYFTTIRLQNSDKYRVGIRHRVFLKNKEIGVAEIVDVKVIVLSNLNAFICGLDTGYSVEETKNILRKMYRNADREYFNLVLYRYLKPEELQE